MKMTRPPGSKEITDNQVQTIIELSQDETNTRGKIARKAGVSKSTVYRYQKKFDLL